MLSHNSQARRLRRPAEGAEGARQGQRAGAQRGPPAEAALLVQRAAAMRPAP